MNTIIEAYKRGYRVTECGDLLNPDGTKIGSLSGGNYMCTTIRIKGRKKMITAHRLQAFQKYGEDVFKEGILVRHLNGDSTDNSWDNIAIGTASDNMMDIPESIRIARALHASSFIKKHPHEEICLFHSKHRSYKKTMEKFNISSKGTLNFIIKKFEKN